MAELAFDLGQTQARVRLIAESGGKSEVELDGFRYGSNVVDTIVDRCTAAARTFGVTSIRAVAGGVTPSTTSGTKPTYLFMDIGTFPGSRIVEISRLAFEVPDGWRPLPAGRPCTCQAGHYEAAVGRLR